jgi:hypothetical protein
MSSAWRTIAKVNSSTFNPGDQILFKRGGIWSENLTFPSSGSAGNPITVGAYESGNAPIMNRLIIQNKSWLNFSSIQTTSVGLNMGLLVYASHDLNFTNTTHNGANQPSNTAVVVGHYATLTWTYNIIFDGCIFKNAGKVGLAPNEGMCGLTINAVTHDIIVKNSQGFGNTMNNFQTYDSQGAPWDASPYNIYFLNNISYDCLTENGIEIGWGVHDSKAIGNYCYGNAVNGIIVSYRGGDAVKNNNVIAYNIVAPHRYGIVVASNSTNTLVYNNTVLMATGWSNPAGIWFQPGTGPGNIAKNNIVYATGISGDHALMVIQDNTDVTSDYNLYFNTVSATYSFAGGAGYTYYANFAAWKAATGQDAHSKWADPLFVNSSSDFHLKSGSPAKDAGVDVGLTSDYEGKPVPFGPTPDIGAYEYNSGFLKLQPPTAIRVVP